MAAVSLRYFKIAACKCRDSSERNYNINMKRTKMKKAITVLAFSSFSLLTLAVNPAQDKNIRIDHVGTNNTLVRIEPDANFLLLPIEEAIDDARIDVLVDGNLIETFYGRIAKDKADYYVPFNLKPFAGHKLILNVTTDGNIRNRRIHVKETGWNLIKTSDDYNFENIEKYRPLYHHTPVYGWMNDPNGMVYADGKWHLYYQWNPYGSKWQNMTWGHSWSDDLMNWHHEPAAIKPNGLGTVFSGSSAIDHNNTAGFGSDAIVTLYTSAGANQMQSLAFSTDGGNTFNIYPGNPVITLETEARDPNFFFNETTGKWNLVLAHALEKEVLIYSSPNLIDWTFESSFGKEGAQHGVWECPDLFPLDIDGKTKWVLIVNLNPGGLFGGSGIQYFIGDFDGKTFTPDTDTEGKVPTRWLDYGKDNYAAVSWSDAPDNRRTLLGWMSNWQYAGDVPTTQFRSANTLPREVKLFRAADGEIYAATPPSLEVRNAFSKIALKPTSFLLGTSTRSFELPSSNDGVCRISLEIDAHNAGLIQFVLKNARTADISANETFTPQSVVMTFDPASQSFKVDRTQSGISDFSSDFPAVTIAPTFSSKNQKLFLEIYIDRSSIEIFGNDGRFAITDLVFPTTPYSTLQMNTVTGKARIDNLTISTPVLK